MNHLGLYAPMGIRPRVNGPSLSPISLKAGQTGKEGSISYVSLSTEQYPVSPPNQTYVSESGCPVPYLEEKNGNQGEPLNIGMVRGRNN